MENIENKSGPVPPLTILTSIFNKIRAPVTMDSAIGTEQRRNLEIVCVGGKGFPFVMNGELKCGS